MKRSKALIGVSWLLSFVIGGCVGRQSEAIRQVEGQQRIHAMLESLPMPPVPTAASCSEAGAERPIYLCLADAHAASACARQATEDMRPYTLCLAETYDDDVELELKQQLATASARAMANTGAAGAAHLAAEQAQWEDRRGRTCATEAAGAPVSEQARAELTCNARLAEPRIAYLRSVAVER